MKTEILVTLLFVAAASASIDGAADDGTGMCPITYLKKHPDVWEKKKQLTEKYGFPDFSKLKSCSSDETCDKGMKCCETPCGMKCIKAVFEDNALETIEQIHKEIGTGVDDKPYEITEEDKKYGMCPNNYMKVHPEVKEEFEKKWKHKHSQEGKGGEKCSHKHSHECKEGEKCSHKHSHECKEGEKCSHKHSHECKGGEKCSHKHSHHKKYSPFRNFTALADCSVDGDCSNNTRCCSTMCGKKCIKPVFTNADLEESLFGKKEEKDNRGKRHVGNDDESDHDNEMEHGRGHGKGKHGKGKHGKGHKKGAGHRKGQCKGGDHENCNGQCNNEEEENGNMHRKGGRHGKGHGEGGKHGKGHGEGGKHGKGQGEGGRHGKGHGEGAKHGKGHGEGAKHGKGHGEGAKHGKGHGEGAKHGKGHGEGARHGKGHGKGLEHGKGHKRAHEDEEEEQFRQKRSTNSMAKSKNSNNHDNGVKHHYAN